MIKNASGIWCVKITISNPDYKRPSANCEVFFFDVYEDAQNKLEQQEAEFLSDIFEFSQKFDDVVYYSNKEIDENDEYIVEDDVDSYCKSDLYNGRFSEYYYEDAYMDMPPFHYELFEICV